MSLEVLDPGTSPEGKELTTILAEVQGLRLGIGVSAGAATPIPVGVNAVQTLTFTGAPTGGGAYLAFSYGGRTFVTQTAVAAGATAAQVQAALLAAQSSDGFTLQGIYGANAVVCAGGPLPGAVTITFGGGLGLTPVGLVGLAANAADGKSPANQLTGGASPAPAVANTTPGAYGPQAQDTLVALIEVADPGSAAATPVLVDRTATASVPSAGNVQSTAATNGTGAGARVAALFYRKAGS